MSEKFQIFLSLLQIFSFSFACKVIVDTYSFPNSDIVLKFEEKTNGLEYFFTRGGNILQRVSLDVKFKKAQILRTKKGVTLTGKNNEKLHFELIEDNPNFSMMHITRNLTKDDISTDCFDLNIGSVSWYGGPENFYQYWPIEKASFANYAYVPKEKGNCAIAERYWLNSNGLFVYIEDDTPLFINQNTEEYPNKLCFSGNKILPYNVRSDTYTFNYRIGIGSNSRTAHLRAVQSVLGKPVAAPDEKMVRYPIWSTWALYKTEINESVVREFAENIVEYEFENSQLEIDDDWEDCYGALTFRKSKFPDIENLTDELKEMGFRITLWIHPFINKNCAEWYNEAKDKNYFVLDHQGNPDTQWWNSKENEAAYIDFTNTEAAKWFNDRLKLLQDMAGIDSFKFDAGESSWTPSDPILNGPLEKYPTIITSDYVRTVAQFGNMVEVRSGYRTQDLPIFLRMLDKDSEWNWNNGLVTLVTTLLQLNMVGYPFVLPDMIGGNGYNNHPPNKEMFIRWLQANTFMPSLQFSYVPWNYDHETINISLKFLNLHDQYTDEIMNRFELAVTNGDPVNPPLWWIAPNDVVAQQIYDQFLLGDDIIVAPVLVQGKIERDIYLPAGKWRDGNTNDIHQGPKWIMRYPAPINVLPYFINANI